MAATIILIGWKMFSLDPQLERDTLRLAALPLCDLLLMNDANYPWLILVPRRASIRELIELNDHDQQQYQLESNMTSQLLQGQFKADKLNIAALGNIVSQLHIHHIARFYHDSAWPKPVWGVLPPLAYTPDELAKALTLILSGLKSQTLVAFDWQQG